jgi:hypothetical protein
VEMEMAMAMAMKKKEVVERKQLLYKRRRKV